MNVVNVVYVDRLNLCGLVRLIMLGRTLGPDFHLNVVYVVCVAGLDQLLC